MDGCHDDTLTCIAMALFVMQFSLEKMEKAKQADAAILSAWTTNNSVKPTNNMYASSISIQPDTTLPFYTSNKANNPFQTSMGDCMWLFAGKM